MACVDHREGSLLEVLWFKFGFGVYHAAGLTKNRISLSFLQIHPNNNRPGPTERKSNTFDNWHRRRESCGSMGTRSTAMAVLNGFTWSGVLFALPQLLFTENIHQDNRKMQKCYDCSGRIEDIFNRRRYFRSTTRGLAASFILSVFFLFVFVCFSLSLARTQPQQLQMQSAIVEEVYGYFRLAI